MEENLIINLLKYAKENPDDFIGLGIFLTASSFGVLLMSLYFKRTQTSKYNWMR